MAADLKVIPRNAKEAKLMKEVREQFTADHWRTCGSLMEETLQTIQSHRKARKALEDLVRAGCNTGAILHEIGFYCGTDTEFMAKHAKYAKGQLEVIAARLMNDAAIIERIVKEHMVEDDYRLYGGARDSPGIMRQIAGALTTALATLKKYTHGKTLTTRHLVYLSYHIEAATKHKHYKEIAHLIAGIQGDTSYNVTRRADAIRRTIERHAKQDPQLFQEEKAVIERDLRLWRRWLSLGKPDTELF